MAIIQDRIDQYEKGLAKTIPWEEVRDKMDAMIKGRKVPKRSRVPKK